MKKMHALLAVILSLFMTGCATSDGFMGLASTQYVNARLAERDVLIEDTDKKISVTREEVNLGFTQSRDIIEKAVSRLSSIDEEVQAVKTRARDLDQILSELVVLKQKTSNLEVFTRELDSKLKILPRNTIEELVIILQKYLGKEKLEVLAPPVEGEPPADSLLPETESGTEQEPIMEHEE